MTSTTRGLLLLLFASCQAAAPQSSTPSGTGEPPVPFEPIPYSSTAWTMEEGLPQNSVNAILQTSDGYLWIATFGGLARFDGVAFTHFQRAENDGPAISRHVALYEDRHGALWIGHELEGLSRYSGGRFTSYGPEDGLPAHQVRALAEDRDGHLWVATDGGLVRQRDGAFDVYGEADGLPSSEILALLVDRTGTLWVGTGAGLVRYHAGRYTTVEAVPRVKVSSLLQAPDGAIWINTDSALLRFVEGSFEPVLERSRPWRAGAALALDREERILALSDSRSELHRFRVDGQHVLAETVRLPPGTTAWTIFVDHEGSVWVGMNGEGLWQLRLRHVQRFTAQNGLPNEEVRTVTQDGDGGFWITLDCNGATVTLGHWRDGALELFPADQNGEQLTCVTSLVRQRSGDIVLASTGQLVRFRDGVFTRSTIVDDPSLHPIYALFEDHDSSLWIGSRRGLLHLDGDRLDVFTTRDGLAHDTVHFIARSRAGTLWIGTNDGLSRFDNDGFVSYKAADGLAPGMVRDVYEDLEGTLWIGTYGGGLSRLRHGRISRLTREDGLFENVISRILEDRHGNLWMLGNAGLSLASRQDLNDVADGKKETLSPRGTLSPSGDQGGKTLFSISFGLGEGMTEGSGGRQPAGWRTEDGRMYFPTIDGLAMIDADNFRKNDTPPPVRIERLLVNGRKTDLDGTVEIAPGQRDLEFHYTALSFAAPAKMRFEYRLENYDEEWVKVGARRIAYYSNLRPGDYTFQVRATNNHGVWNETDRPIGLVIQPFLYEEPWFWSLGALFLLMFGYVIIRHRVRSVEERNRRLQNEIDERRRIEAEREALIAKLEAQNAELERFTYTVSHDLKAPIVTIKGFLGLLEKDAATGNSERLAADIDRIGRAADTMGRILDDLLELSRIGRVFHPPEGVAMTELAREAADLVGGAIAARSVEVVIDDAMPVVHGDRIRLLEVFENLLDNAVKFLGKVDEPRIEIGQRSQGGETVYYVRDNGPGVEVQYQEKIFGLFERLDTATEGTGIGLALVKRIVEVHAGRIWVESEGTGTGSAFCFTLGDLSASDSG